MIYKKIIFIIFFITIFANSYCSEIIFDQTYDQSASPFDLGFAGMSILTNNLRKAGFSVSLNSKPLKNILNKHLNSTLVLAPTMFRKYNNEDIRAINLFIKNGGNIIIISEHDNAYNNADSQNQLSSKYNIITEHKNIYSNKKNILDNVWVNFNCNKLKLNKIKLFYAASLKIKKPSFKLLIANNKYKPNIGGALNIINKGKVFVISDYEIFWNMTKTTGIQFKNNLKFLIKIFKYISYKPQKYIDFKFKKYNSSKKILFLTSSECLKIDNSISGLYLFAKKLNSCGYNIETGNETALLYNKYDLIVIACPLKKLNNIDIIIKNNRLLLIGDGQTSMMEGISPIFLTIMKQNYNMRYNLNDYYYPLNDIALKWGFKFSRSVITKGNKKNKYFIKAIFNNTKKEFNLIRSSIILPIKNKFNKNIKIIAETKFKYFSEKTLVPELYSNSPYKKSSMLLPKNTNLKKIFSVCISSSNIFALSDMELFTNQYFNSNNGKEMFNVFYKWLKN